MSPSRRGCVLPSGICLASTTRDGSASVSWCRQFLEGFERREVAMIRKWLCGNELRSSAVGATNATLEGTSPMHCFVVRGYLTVFVK